MDEHLNTVLTALGLPVRRLLYELLPGEELPAAYITFQNIVRQPNAFADDDNTEVLNVYRVNLFSKSNYKDTLKELITALKTGGFVISSVDGELYERETGFFHVPVTINILEE